MKHNPFPLIGVLVSFALFVWAALLYPGGYDWTRDFISALFAPETPAGEANKARYVAILAMFVLCASVAVIFKLVAMRARGRTSRKTLEIGGIGAAVYAFLVVTPMHDLLIGIALLFYFPAMATALSLVRGEGRVFLFWSGLMCLGILSSAAIMYYGRFFWDLLPLAQKAALAACVGWLLALQLSTDKWPVPRK